MTTQVNYTGNLRHNATIYKKARNNCKITIQDIAEQLYVTDRTVARYENGEIIPADETVMRMAEAYKDPWLVYEHIQANHDSSQLFLPDIERCSLLEATARMKLAVAKLHEATDEMLAYSLDGQITADEVEQWQKHMDKLRAVAGAYIALICAGR